MCVALALLGLTGCAHQSQNLPEVAHLPANQAVVTELNAWTLQAKLGLVADQERLSMQVLWQQETKDTYQLTFIAPLGQGQAQLTAGPAWVRWQDSQGYRAQATSAQALLKQELGWDLPLPALHWWIRGLLTPNLPQAHLTYHPQGDLKQAQQGDWLLEWPTYTQVNAEYRLPRKVRLTHQQRPLSATWVIYGWTLPKVTSSP
ncbi:outer membrane lipoprotein LolB [Allopseudospirillum japonicum]|uniref:Outer-membrane lipoprotein LolB n=2 Tax=Allopseudospirillum japonicum TaxID=64971 RepID=A0A1H6S5W9_9GAMM|nr:outer membrane lipoprotein LolB [Allopseudospirillum japonicum]